MSADPLSGPFPTSADLTGYADEPGYAIPARDVVSGYDYISGTLARLGLPPAGKAA